MKMKGLVGSLLVAFALFGAAHASAGDAIAVSATVPVSCTISNISALAFGEVTGESVVTAQGSLTVNCPDGTNYVVDADDGLSVDGTTRRMVLAGSTTDFLPYNLYQGASGTMDWDGATTASGTTDASGTATVQYHGEVPAISNPAPGSYTDTVTLTVDLGI